jgi:hypothetical protein
MDFREIGLGGVDCIRLAQDRDRWRAVVSAVMNLPVFCTTELICILASCGGTISTRWLSSGTTTCHKNFVFLARHVSILFKSLSSAELVIESEYNQEPFHVPRCLHILGVCPLSWIVLSVSWMIGQQL